MNNDLTPMHTKHLINNNKIDANKSGNIDQTDKGKHKIDGGRGREQNILKHVNNK